MNPTLPTAAAWLSRFDKLCSGYEETLQSHATAEAELLKLIAASDSPVDGITLQLQRQFPYADIHLGKESTGASTDSETTDLAGYSCRICIWRNNRVGVSNEELRKILIRFAHAHWKPNLHDQISRLLSFQYPQTKNLLENTIAHSAGKIYLLFTDLDHFKQEVNDKHGQDGGDQAILQFGAFLDDAVRPNATAIHRSGDEYCALIFSDTAEQALATAETVMRAIHSKQFDIKGNRIKLSTTIGLTSVPSTYTAYSEIENLAVQSIKPASGKQRGKIRFSQYSGKFPTILVTQSNIQLAHCLLRTNVLSSYPFASPVLNLLAEEVYQRVRDAKGLADIQAVVETALQAATVEVIPGLLQAAANREEGPDVSMHVGPLDVAIAVAHGLYRARVSNDQALPRAQSLAISFDKNASNCNLIVQPSQGSSLTIGKVGPNPQMFDLGAFVSSAGAASQYAGHRALLIRIGHQSLGLPKSLFADLIVVDDRPTKGGGLPDFWEATIARVINVIDRNPNIEAVYVLGEERFASLTARKLRGIDQWERDAEGLAYKTGVSGKKIKSAAARLAGRVTFLTVADDLIQHLSEILRRPAVLKPAAQNVIEPGGAFLERTLSEGDIRLGLGDGCRITTIARAYPVVIEIIRKTTQWQEARDQAGVSLRELTDFKVQLTNPSQDKVPAFYKNEVSSLEDYFHREFISKDGTFGRILDQTQQVDAVLRHVANVYKHFAASTRRAIMIIPHNNPTDEIAPLGLVCVRIVPRIIKATLRLDFSFVWRTVEALVGFPYSLYGSVRFSEHLTDQLRAMVEPDQTAVELGEVSYVAQSLHMFDDEYGQIIARRIVNDASI